MARRPAPSTRSTRGLRRPGREAGGSPHGSEGSDPSSWGRLDPQQRLAALIARGYGDASPEGPGLPAAGSGWDDAGDVGEGGDEGDEPARPAVGRGGRGRHRRGAVRADDGDRPAPAVWSLPSSLVDARRAVSWRAVAAVAALVAIAGGVFAVRVGSARASAQPQTAVASPLTRTGTPAAFATGTPTSRSSTGRAAATDTMSSTGGVPSASVELVVDVAGQVARPGVVRLPAGSRVADALARAGGAGAGADLSVVNLARPLVDGERLYVPRPGEAPPTVLGPVVGSGGVGAGGAGGAGSGVGGAGAGGVVPGAPVDLNRADLAALDALPGVGPVLAQRILDWRGQHGRFSSVDELGEVSGIGDKLLGTLRPLVTV